MWLITPYHQDCLHYDTLALHYYAIWFQCRFHFYMIHLCYMYRVISGGNLVRFSKESVMLKTRMISLDTWYNTSVRVIFIICLKLIIVECHIVKLTISMIRPFSLVNNSHITLYPQLEIIWKVSKSLRKYWGKYGQISFYIISCITRDCIIVENYIFGIVGDIHIN